MVNNSPPNFVDVFGLYGIGYTIAASAEVGVGFHGAAATGAGGMGLFYDRKESFGSMPINAGGWLAHGEMARWGKHVAQHPCPGELDEPQVPWVMGADAGGIGEGIFFTNADSAAELDGPFRQWNFITPMFSFSWGMSKGTQGTTFIASLTIGPSAGFGVSAYPTTTKTFP